MNMLTLKIPDLIKRKLDNYTRKMGLSQSEVVREALLQYLSREDVKQEGSFTDLSSDLAGSVIGPPDLSTSKAHLEGYGS